MLNLLVVFMLILCHNYFRVTQNNKNDSEDLQHYSKKKFVFGLFILLLVDVLWVVSSELTKYIYLEQKIDRPFLVTYIRSSLLFVYLVVLCFSPPTRDPCRPADYTQLLEPTAEADEDNFFTDSNNSLVSTGDSTFVPVRAGETTDSDDAAPRAVRFNKVAEVRVMSAAMAGEALLARLSWAASVRASEFAQRRAAAQATRRHLRMALVFTAPWFVSNYLYRLALRGARPGAATLLASAAGALALTLGAARAPDRLSLARLAGVLLTAAALVMLGVTEGRGGDWSSVLAALGAALSYAGHLLLLRRELRRGPGINEPLLVGLVGCACGVFGWALGGALAAGGVERATLPAPRACSWLLLDAALGPLLLESLWLWGRSLTSPYAATCALGAAAPLAAGWDALDSGGAWRATAGLLAGLGWALAATDAPGVAGSWLERFRSDGFSVIRNIPELDEQSEALMSSDEPT